MKKIMSILFAGAATLVLSGCGGGGDYNAPEVTYYLQTENAFGDFVGVNNV